MRVDLRLLDTASPDVMAFRQRLPSDLLREAPARLQRMSPLLPTMRSYSSHNSCGWAERVQSETWQVVC